MAEISGRAVGFGAGCALLGVALAFASSSEAATRPGESARCGERAILAAHAQAREPDGRFVHWRGGGSVRSAPIR